jgi:SAM-dependent methyltransferase
MNPEEYRQLTRLGETHWWFVGTRDILFSSLDISSLPAGPILDVGCGSGLMMKRFAETGPIFGVDADHGALAHCKSIGFDRLCRGNATALPFTSGTFGFIIAADLLEHCEDDSAVLAEIYRVMSPGGMLLASVPAYGVLWSSHDVALHHKRRYLKRELADKARAAGFSVERASYFNMFLFPPAALMRLTVGKMAGNKPDNRIKYHENLRLLNRILLGLIRLENRLLDRFDLPFGLSILLLASKK